MEVDTQLLKVVEQRRIELTNKKSLYAAILRQSTELVVQQSKVLIFKYIIGLLAIIGGLFNAGFRCGEVENCVEHS